jgi:Fe2+ or Zn2+ uptake regulation protein
MSHHALGDLVVAGTRITVQRRLIWNTLHHAGGHLTAEALRARLAKRLPGLNLPTIYRNLVFLRGLGLVQELRAFDGPGRFEAILPGERHSHLACRLCGRIEHLESEALADMAGAAAAAQGYQGTSAEVVIYAECADCSSQHATPARASG